MLLRNALLSAALVLLVSPVACAQGLSPFSAFLGLSPAELATVQVKFTYVGPSDPLLSSLAFASSPGALDARLFLPYHRPEYSYACDTLSLVTFNVTPEALSAAIDSIATLPNVTDGDVDANGYVSFSMLRTAGGTYAFEAIVNQAGGQALIVKLEEALQGANEAQRKVAAFACATSLAYENPPEEVTHRATISVSGFRRLRGSDEFSAKVRITNASGSAIATPLILLPGVVGANVEVVNADGVTCAIRPVGEYISVPVGPGGLAPGAHADVVLKVRNPSNARVRLEPTVFAGAGSR